MAATIHCSSDVRSVPSDRCIACENRQSALWPCLAARGADFLFFRFGQSREIEVPVCLRCRGLRWIAGYAAAALAAVAIMLGVLWTLPWLDGEGLVQLWIALTIVAVVGIIWFVRNPYSPLMDRMLLGVYARRLFADGSVELWIRDERFAEASRDRCGAPPDLLQSAELTTITIVGNWAPEASPQAASSPQPGRIERFLEHPFVKPRVLPALAVAAGVGLFAIDVWYADDSSFVFVFPIFAGPVFVLFGLGGLIYPRLFWVLRDFRIANPRRRSPASKQHVSANHGIAPIWLKAIGVGLLAAGIGIGFWCAVHIFGL